MRNEEGDPVGSALLDRPYCPWRLLPLMAVLKSRGVPTVVRDRCVDAVANGESPDSLVRYGWIAADHLRDVEVAIREGERKGWRSRQRDGIGPIYQLLHQEVSAS